MTDTERANALADAMLVLMAQHGMTAKEAIEFAVKEAMRLAIKTAASKLVDSVLNETKAPCSIAIGRFMCRLNTCAQPEYD